MSASSSSSGDVKVNVQKQLESIFQPANLRNDPALLAQMNSERFVSLDIVGALPSIRSITTDRSVLIAAIAASSHLQLDENQTAVKPSNLKVERVTLILRDIPSDIAAEKVRELFKGLTDAPISLNAEVGNNWFVNFANEDACTKAVLHLRSQTFDGKPVQARVKSENLLRTYNPATPSARSAATAAILATATSSSSSSSSSAPSSATSTSAIPAVNIAAAINSNRPVLNVSLTANGAAVPAPFMPPFAFVDPKILQQYASAQQNQKAAASSASSGKGARDANLSSPDGRKKTQQNRRRDDMQLGPEHFPALPTPAKKSGVTEGYSREFIKYTREEMASFIKTMPKDLRTKPESLEHLPSAALPAVHRLAPLADSQLLLAFPVFYPASPSPMLAARGNGGDVSIPSFNLGGASSTSTASSSSPNVRPLPPTLMDGSYSLPPSSSASASSRPSQQHPHHGSMGSAGGFHGHMGNQKGQKPFSAVLSAAKAAGLPPTAPPRRNNNSNNSSAAAAAGASSFSASSNSQSNPPSAPNSPSKPRKTKRRDGSDSISSTDASSSASSSVASSSSLSLSAEPPKRTAASIVAQNVSKPVVPLSQPQPQQSAQSTPKKAESKAAASSSSSNGNASAGARNNNNNTNNSNTAGARSGGNNSNANNGGRKGDAPRSAKKGDKAASDSSAAAAPVDPNKPLSYAAMIKKAAAASEAAAATAAVANKQ